MANPGGEGICLDGSGPYLHGMGLAKLIGRHPARHIRSRHGPGDTVALRQGTADGQQGGFMLGRLHTLGHHLTMKDIRQLNDTLDDGQVVPVDQHVAHEGAVDLEGIGRDVLEVGQG